MYVDHFKLSDKPFQNCPADGFFTPNEEFESAVARMEQVLLSRDAVAVITGGPGVGKTTIVSTAAQRVGDKAIVAYVDMRLTDPDLLYDLLLLNLGDESGGGDQATSLYRLKSTIARHNNEQGRSITAVIDVSSLTIERAKRILQLVHMAGEPGGQLNIILIGPHILHKLLDTPGLIHIRQRVTFRYRARPLTAAETEAYLEQQLERSGGQPDSILEHDAPMMVYRYIGGVPRLINTLMDATLSYAAEKEANTVTSKMVSQVAQLLGWRLLSNKQSSGTEKSGAASTVGSARKKAPESPAVFSQKQEEPSPLETSAAGSSQPDPVEKKSSDQSSASISDGTAMLMAASLDAGASSTDDNKLELKLAESETKSADKSAGASEAPKSSNMPEMDASDTSATGMLRLEDLDARFAETVFGEDNGMFTLDDDTKKATG